MDPQGSFFLIEARGKGGSLKGVFCRRLFGVLAFCSISTHFGKAVVLGLRQYHYVLIDVRINVAFS